MSEGTEKKKNRSISTVLSIMAIMETTAKYENGRELRSLAQNFIVPQKMFGLDSFIANSYSSTNTLSDKICLLIYNFEFSISNFLIRLIDLRHHLLAFFHTVCILSQIRMVLQRKIMVSTFDLLVGSILVYA